MLFSGVSNFPGPWIKLFWHDVAKLSSGNNGDSEAPGTERTKRGDPEDIRLYSTQSNHICRTTNRDACNALPAYSSTLVVQLKVVFEWTCSGQAPVQHHLFCQSLWWSVRPACPLPLGQWSLRHAAQHRTIGKAQRSTRGNP